MDFYKLDSHLLSGLGLLVAVISCQTAFCPGSTTTIAKRVNLTEPTCPNLRASSPLRFATGTMSNQV
jgi:hypothetical protein